ncbi:MAG: hypothetical protein H6Q14_33 [Bacteroidetes bacterium]|jgi:hypothetical protein|nr:hypothetical protein [Bacteroidota bacterium]
MPYRRLPNTDAGRIRALKKGLEMLLHSSNNSCFQKINSHLLQTELTNFEGLYRHYNDALRTQTASSKKLQQLSKNARIYVSHFIQVLNLAVIRKEINKELKSLYGLNIDSNTVPDLISNEQILKWGERIISGENLRKMQGGSPIYNPSIARVNVTYSQFKDACFVQKIHQDSTNKWLEKLRIKRKIIDQLIHSLWNAIEEKFSSEGGQIDLETCKTWGLVYYLRKSEREATKQ